MRRHVLMVAFHFPPFGGSSGSRRTIAFARYLPRDGWDPLVLTVNERAYEQIKPQELRDISADMPVVRAFALDAARHLAVGGRYPARLAVPDRWRSWQPFARRAGRQLIRKYRPAIIWSTYPIASAHAIAASLQARTGIPWVADMRDPMVEKDPYSGIEYPRDPQIRAARLRIEQAVAAQAAHVVFCTPAARDIFLTRFGRALEPKTSVIPNGYDEEAFQQAEQSLARTAAPRAEFHLIHSGTVYPGDDRGPGALFKAVGQLRANGVLPPGFRLILRASGYDAEIGALISASGVEGVVQLAPALPYREALQEMLTAEGLLLLQGAASNPAVPAKVYEYLRARRPILGLVHPEGESAALLQRLQAAIVAPLDDAARISTALAQFIEACERGVAPLARPDAVAALSRAAQARELAELLSQVAAEQPGDRSAAALESAQI
ncbi:MAG TPA: glycosyltransferase [Steroidobacteraceae bacterium]|nr:glycosyltransferase [Steroidobacteraceae bacterium]